MPERAKPQRLSVWICREMCPECALEAAAAGKVLNIQDCCDDAPSCRGEEYQPEVFTLTVCDSECMDKGTPWATENWSCHRVELSICCRSILDTRATSKSWRRLVVAMLLGLTFWGMESNFLDCDWYVPRRSSCTRLTRSS